MQLPSATNFKGQRGRAYLDFLNLEDVELGGIGLSRAGFLMVGLDPSVAAAGGGQAEAFDGCDFAVLDLELDAVGQ